MTTADVYIHRTGTRNYLSLRNGLFGPATTLFHSVLRACKDGTASGSWSGSHADVVLRAPRCGRCSQAWTTATSSGTAPPRLR